MADETHETHETHDAPPLADEQLAEISARAKNIGEIRAVGPRNLSDLERGQLQAIAVAYADDVSDLLAEAERLRAREVAAMAIVGYVVERENATVQMLGLNRGVACGYCHQWLNNEHQQHAPDCIMIKARALLADEGH